MHRNSSMAWWRPLSTVTARTSNVPRRTGAAIPRCRHGRAVQAGRRQRRETGRPLHRCTAWPYRHGTSSAIPASHCGSWSCRAGACAWRSAARASAALTPGRHEGDLPGDGRGSGAGGRSAHRGTACPGTTRDVRGGRHPADHPQPPGSCWSTVNAMRSPPAEPQDLRLAVREAAQPAGPPRRRQPGPLLLAGDGGRGPLQVHQRPLRPCVRRPKRRWSATSSNAASAAATTSYRFGGEEFAILLNDCRGQSPSRHSESAARPWAASVSGRPAGDDQHRLDTPAAARHAQRCHRPCGSRAVLREEVGAGSRLQ